MRKNRLRIESANRSHHCPTTIGQLDDCTGLSCLGKNMSTSRSSSRVQQLQSLSEIIIWLTCYARSPPLVNSSSVTVVDIVVPLSAKRQCSVCAIPQWCNVLLMTFPFLLCSWWRLFASASSMIPRTIPESASLSHNAQSCWPTQPSEDSSSSAASTWWDVESEMREWYEIIEYHWTPTNLKPKLLASHGRCLPSSTSLDWCCLWPVLLLFSVIGRRPSRETTGPRTHSDWTWCAPQDPWP